MCPHWDRLHTIYSDRSGMIPPFVSDSVDNPEEASSIENDDRTALYLDNNDDIIAPSKYSTLVL